jgi:DNA end-binding protein Ku
VLEANARNAQQGTAMPRPIWNGTISFGLLNVPVQLFSGERSVDLHFRMLDGRDKKPIRYERINSETGEEVPWKDVVKAFEHSKGHYVVLDEKELRAAHPEATETVEIEAFIENDAIDPRFFEKPYYLVPGKKAEKGYVLLREVLKKSKKIGIAKVVIRTRQYLAAILPLENALILNLMRFPQELVAADEFKLPDAGVAKYRITPKELEMATALVESMATSWNPADYKDDFRAKLHSLVTARVGKAKRGKKAPVVEQAAGSNVVDFMALLKKSIAAKQPSARSAKAASRPRRAG